MTNHSWGMCKKSNIVGLIRQCTKKNIKEDFMYYDERGCAIIRQFEDVNTEIINLHQMVENLILEKSSIDALGVMMWMRDAGNSQESAICRDDFENLVVSANDCLSHRLLYYHDCEALVNSLQNRFCMIEHALNEIYKYISPRLSMTIREYDDVVFTMDSTSTIVHTLLNSLFINMASCCDILTKIAYELDHLDELDFSIYPKMKSRSILYGNKSKLRDTLKCDNTIFANARPKVVAKVESLRDEIVHNGSFDFYCNLYYGSYGDILEKWILCPEFTDSGTLATYNNRRKFYADSTFTFNEQLPIIILEFTQLVTNTLVRINSEFSVSRTLNL